MMVTRSARPAALPTAIPMIVDVDIFLEPSTGGSEPFDEDVPVSAGPLLPPPPVVVVALPPLVALALALAGPATLVYPFPLQ